MVRARIYRSAKREFECKILDTGKFVSANALGNLLKKKNSLVVGDYVSLSLHGNQYEIHHVEKRKNKIFRFTTRNQKKKINAANCDLLVIVTAVSLPEYKRGIIDRFLIRAHQWGIPTILVFNKMDQFDDKVMDLNFESDRVVDLGVSSYEISATDQSYKNCYLKNGMVELEERLKGKTSL